MPASSSITAFPPSGVLRSQLITNPPSAIPSVEDLISLEEELKLLQTRAEARQKKADADLVVLEAIMKKVRDKERPHDTKGKAKERDIPLASLHSISIPPVVKENSIISKIKRESTRTPDVDEDDFALADHLPSRPSSLKAKIDLKKKKRKREIDSDGESRDNHKMVKPSPVPTSDHPPPKKQPKVTPVVGHGVRFTNGGYRIAEDFSEPSTSQIPTRPPPQTLPVPGPLKPADVQDDFSKAKPPTQTSITTFYSSIEPWLRPIREDELGLLEWDGDIVEPFLVPPLGKHYIEQWEEEDKTLYAHSLAPTLHPPDPGPSTSARLSHNANWAPNSLTDAELATDERGVGPLAERLVSALLIASKSELPVNGQGKTDKEKEEASKSSLATLKGNGLNTMDLEDRLKSELQAIGFPLDEEIDFPQSDDQVLAELRKCQRALREQLVLNKARRTRLHSIAQDRLAYQEYLETRDVLDRQITTVYTRLQKKDSVKSANLKKRKKPGSSAAQAEREEKEKEKEREMMCLAALGLGPDPTGKLVVPESLQHAVRLRRRWVDVVGKELTRKQELNPGRLYGVPAKSIYEGIDADVKMLEANMFAEQDVDG